MRWKRVRNVRNNEERITSRKPNGIATNWN
ncbi:hypothetical protein ABID50_001631 [Streptococcus parasuis]|uniref:Uncharacterized protein n=1 Tax=Streptococcus parasuis TaxID=1501662 RepID=A0ABV2ETG1_9STRE